MHEALERVKAGIAQAAQKVGRTAEEIALVAVSKGGTLGQVQALMALGQTDFGENRAQALRDKAEAFEENLRWHHIGQLQSNKVKAIIDHVWLVHSLDRLSLASELDRQAKRCGRTLDALIQIRLEESPARGGIDKEGVKALLEGCAQYDSLRIQGLMCLAPLHAQGPLSTRYFAQARDVFESLVAYCPDNAGMNTLSMGMSHDYPYAIEQGATMVRVGSALFAGQAHRE